MSHSPTGAAEDKEYLEGWSATYELLRQGKSWSGREANNAFLNVGDGRFVDVSAVAGLDFADDGRGLAVVDWDRDGALDLVVSNRSGPQVRFLGNRAAAGGHFLALRLEGRRSNRDAVGARAVLFLADGRRLMRAVRAGDGYLSQSSKWLHFGLGGAGEAAVIEKLEVRWPGGAVEEIRGLEADRWYRLVEGNGAATGWKPPPRPAFREEAPGSLPPEAFDPHGAPVQQEPPGRTFLLHPLPLFELPYRSVAGEPVAVPRDLRGPVLINLWASWCANCRQELKELQGARGELTAAGIDVLALTVDEPEDLPAAEAYLDEVGWTFPRGVAEPEILDLLNLAYQAVVDLPRGMAVPMSFLVDREHRLLAAYRGPVSPEQVLADAEAAARGDGGAAWPFAGRWADRPKARDLQLLANLLRSHGYGERAAAYLGLQDLDPQAPQWRRDDLARSWEEVGEALLAEGRPEEAEAAWRKGLAVEPAAGSLLHGLGRALLEQGETGEALPYLRRAFETLPEDAGLRANLGLALARAGRPAEAAGHFEKALELAGPKEPARRLALYNLAVYRETQGRRAEALEHLEQCLESWPEDFETLRFLGVVRQRSGKFRQAVAAYEKALAVEPEDARTVFYLGRAHLSLGDLAAARRQLERLVELEHPSAQRLLKDLQSATLSSATLPSATQAP